MIFLIPEPGSSQRPAFSFKRNALAKNNEAVHKGAAWKKASFLITGRPALLMTIFSRQKRLQQEVSTYLLHPPHTT
jgi:hypothetical protein